MCPEVTPSQLGCGDKAGGGALEHWLQGQWPLQIRRGLPPGCSHGLSGSAEGQRAGDWLPQGLLGHLVQELSGLSALGGEQL